MKNKFHYWLIQLRRPLCFIAVLAIVAVYIVSGIAYADTDTTFGTVYGMPDDCFDLNFGLSAYTAAGYDVNNLNYNIDGNQFLCDRTESSYSNSETAFDYLKNLEFLQNITISSNLYDLVGRKIIISYSNGSVYLNYFGYPSSYEGSVDLAIVDGKVVASSSNRIISVKINLSALLQNSNVRDSIVDAVTSNLSLLNSGLYVCNSSDVYFTNIIFTDMPIYFSSTDGASGFIAQQAQDFTNFSFSNSSNYFNFNIYSASNVDPVFEPQGQFYNYAYVTGYITPVSSSSFNTHLSFSYNEYMRTHPEEYDVRILTFASLYTNSQNNSTPNFKYSQRFPLTNVTNSSSHFDSDNSSYVNLVTFDDLQDTGGNSVSDALKEIYVSAGGSAGLYEPDTIVKLDPIILGTHQYSYKWNISNYFSTRLQKIVIQQTIYFIWKGGEPESASGTLKLRYETGNDASTVEGNDIVNNYNPPSVSDPQYPQNIVGGGGNVTNNTPVNVQVNVENVAREIFSPFMLEDGTVSSANVASNWNFMLQQLGDMNAENGFWEVIKGTYDALPEGVTTMVYSAIAAILGCAVFRFYITCIRGA